jgi:hypothetical protein
LDPKSEVFMAANEILLHIESVPTVPAEVLLDALAAEGVRAEVVLAEARLELRVASDELGSVLTGVGCALDRIVAELPRGLVPDRLSPTSFFIRPAAA